LCLVLVWFSVSVSVCLLLCCCWVCRLDPGDSNSSRGRECETETETQVGVRSLTTQNTVSVGCPSSSFVQRENGMMLLHAPARDASRCELPWRWGRDSARSGVGAQDGQDDRDGGKQKNPVWFATASAPEAPRAHVVCVCVCVCVCVRARARKWAWVGAPRRFVGSDDAHEAEVVGPKVRNNERLGRGAIERR